MTGPLSPAAVLLLAPAHLGALHPVERALTLILAFGPFVALGIVVVLRRRADAAELGTEVGAETGDRPVDEVGDDVRGGVLDGNRDQHGSGLDDRSGAGG